MMFYIKTTPIPTLETSTFTYEILCKVDALKYIILKKFKIVQQFKILSNQNLHKDNLCV